VKRSILCQSAAMLAMIWLPMGVAQAGWTPSTLFTFAAPVNTGGPNQNLVADSAGNLYGSTIAGGKNALGGVFELSPPAKGQTAWTERLLYSSVRTGYKASSPLILDQAGNLYGTFEDGGTKNYGLVFELVRPAKAKGTWAFKKLYLLKGGNDGYDPNGLIFNASYTSLYFAAFGGEKFYPASSRKQPTYYGNIHQLTAPAVAGGAWTNQVIYNCTGDAGGNQPGSFIFDNAGNLYGVTGGGGAAAGGDVFELSPPASGTGSWSYNELYAFQDSLTSQADGYIPTAIVFGATGNIYGATGDGGAHGFGTLFALTPPAHGQSSWSKTILYNFAGLTDGSNPRGGLTLDTSGNLYGTNGGNSLDSIASTVFELSPPASGQTAWTQTTLISAAPISFYSGVLSNGGNFYGVMSGNSDVPGGYIFELTP